MTQRAPTYHRRFELPELRDKKILSVWTRYTVEGRAIDDIAGLESCSRQFVNWCLDEMNRRKTRGQA